MVSKKKTQRDVPPNHRDPEVVRKAEAIFAEMGMTPEEAVAKFYELVADQCQHCLRTGRVPNEETLAALREAKEENEILIYTSVDEMMAEFYDANPTHLSPVPTRPPSGV